MFVSNSCIALFFRNIIHIPHKTLRVRPFHAVTSKPLDHSSQKKHSNQISNTRQIRQHTLKDHLSPGGQRGSYCQLLDLDVGRADQISNTRSVRKHTLKDHHSPGDQGDLIASFFLICMLGKLLNDSIFGLVFLPLCPWDPCPFCSSILPSSYCSNICLKSLIFLSWFFLAIF